MDLDITKLRLGDLQFRVNKFIDINLQQWFDEEITQNAQKLAWNVGLSENAIETIYSEKSDFLKCRLIWDLEGPNGEPLSIFLEKGTKAHDINAKKADYLSWVDKMGKRIFRKKVRHPGFRGYRIIEKSYNDGKQNLQKRIKKEVSIWLQVNKIV